MERKIKNFRDLYVDSECFQDREKLKDFLKELFSSSSQEPKSSLSDSSRFFYQNNSKVKKIEIQIEEQK